VIQITVPDMDVVGVPIQLPKFIGRLHFN